MFHSLIQDWTIFCWPVAVFGIVLVQPQNWVKVVMGKRTKAKLHKGITQHGLGQSVMLVGLGISFHSKIEKSWKIVGMFYF